MNAKLCHKCNENYVGRHCPKCTPLSVLRGKIEIPSGEAVAGNREGKVPAARADCAAPGNRAGGGDTCPCCNGAGCSSCAHGKVPRWMLEQITNANDHHADDTGTTAKLERDPCHEPLEARQGQEAVAGRVHVRFESVRKRLLDPDNICEKFYLDCLRYCGAVSGDEPDKIVLETTQRKAAKGETEKTVITITYP